MNCGCSISCHDEIVSNEDLAEEAGKDVEQIQPAADSCGNLRPIVDLLVGHSMHLELRCLGYPAIRRRPLRSREKQRVPSKSLLSFRWPAQCITRLGK